MLMLSGCNGNKNIDIKICNQIIYVDNHITNNHYSVSLQSNEFPDRLIYELTKMNFTRKDEPQIVVYDTINLSFCENVKGGEYVNVLNKLNNVGVLKLKLGKYVKTKFIKFSDCSYGSSEYRATYHVAKIDRDKVVYSVEKCISEKSLKEIVYGSDQTFFTACYSSSFDKLIGDYKIKNGSISLKEAKNSTSILYIKYMDESLWENCVNKYHSVIVENDDCQYDSHRIVVGNDSKMIDIESMLALEITKYDSISEMNGRGIGFWKIDIK